MTTEQIPAGVDARVRATVEQFYAHHMQLLDDGRIKEWAAGFTEDGTFTVGSHPVPARGREEIVAGATHTVEQLRAQGIARRHWLGMADISAESGGEGEGNALRVRSYALVFQITASDGPALRSSTTCEDVLVPDGGSWLIKSRLVITDAPA
jgi:3-phenylpropionate/cinnamic acid dioxygenase small subunit